MEEENKDLKKLDLNNFIAENKLPCFCRVNIINEQTSEDSTNQELVSPSDSEIIYLYKKFETDCLFAKCYSNILQTYLLQHRPSYVPTESELTLTINNQTTNIQYLFSDIVSIPIAYPGLFEVFSSNSVKTDGILDHERDIGSFATRLHKPKFYYVAKEMKVYEIQPDKANFSLTNFTRKWTKIKQGCVIKALRVVSIDYEDTSNKLFTFLKKVFCCNSAIKKTDFAIEFKVIENFDDMKKKEVKINREHSDEFDIGHKVMDIKATHTRLSKANLIEKSFYLPFYESNGPSEEIDLIPISSIIKNQKLNSNSLQLAKNFASSSNLQEQFIELKLFEENPFQQKPKNDNSKHIVEQAEMIQENQHLELEKYMSIYDLVQFRTNCNLIVGYSFSKQCLIFIPLEQINLGLNKKCLFSKIGETDNKNDKKINFFKSNLREKFFDLAEHEIETFELGINKIETFAFKKKNFEGLKLNEIESFFVKPSSKPIKQITHFSDLIQMDQSLISENLKNVSKEEKTEENEATRECKTKFNSLPHNRSSDLKDLETSSMFAKVKRTTRSYSLPVDKAFVFKKYVNSKVRDIDLKI